MATLSRSRTFARHSLGRPSGDCGPGALTRILQLHDLLAASRPVDAVSFARERELDPRTIKRDLDILKNRGAPIIWDAKLKSYRYTAPFDFASGLRLDAEEALTLVLAGRTLSAWGAAPLGRTLTATLEKIARFAGPAISFPAADLHAILHQDDATLDAPEHRHFSRLIEDVRARREIVVLYQKPSTARPERRTLRPLHLAYLDHRWMLVAEDIGRKAWRNFVLPRIHSIEPTVRTFSPPPTERIKKYLAGSLGRFTGDREIEVRLRFSPTAAPYVRERPWHASQTITALPDDAIEVTLRLNNLVDVQRRLLANGRHVEVLAPPELRVSLAAEVAALAQTYAAEIDVTEKNSAKNQVGHPVSLRVR